MRMWNVICEFAVTLLPFLGLMGVYAAGAVIADYVLPHIDAIKELVPWYKQEDGAG